MVPFSAPVEDILFSLREVAGADRVESWDEETAADILGHFAQFAEGVIAPLNAIGDRQGVWLENGRVLMPDGFVSAYGELAESGWQGLTAPEAYGGMGLSPLIGMGVSEIFSGANHAMQMVCNLVPGAISTLLHFGSVSQQEIWIPRLAQGEALSTMCLSEPGAGSDLSAIRTKAKRDGANWRVSGEKIFISGGDQNMSDDILHLVLARTGDDGLKGLSLFLCQRQPAAKVARVEKKLGLHASPTCQLVFDDAEAELVGNEGAGLQAMFTLMNHARIDVALQGVAHAARALQISNAYAHDRRQGRTAGGSVATLRDHADVKRMLDRQAVLAVGARGMCHVAAIELALGERPALAEFLTPICKVFGSEAGIKSADLGIQILGGYGYLDEYGMHQIWRDARICAIYEGANGIHTRSLATRGLRPGRGADEFAALIAELSGGNAQVSGVLIDWQSMRDRLSLAADPTPSAHRFYKLTADLLLKAIWARIAAVADAHSQEKELRRLASHVLSEPKLA